MIYSFRHRNSLYKYKDYDSSKLPSKLQNESKNKTNYNSEKKTEENKLKCKSACVQKQSGFFNPKNLKKSNIAFNGSNNNLPKEDLFSKLGKNPKVKKFFQSEKFKHILENMNKIGLYENYIVATIAVTIKPIALLAVPGAKQEDKEYSATKAALAGVVDFAIASVIIKPVSKQLDKFKKFVNKNPELIKDKIDYLKDKKKFASFQKVVGYIPKYLTIPIKAAVTILLIPPTLKILFPNHSKSKVAEKKTNDTNIQNNKNQFLSSTQLETMSRQLNDKSVKLFESYSDQNIKMIKNHSKFAKEINNDNFIKNIDIERINMLRTFRANDNEMEDKKSLC